MLIAMPDKTIVDLTANESELLTLELPTAQSTSLVSSQVTTSLFFKELVVKIGELVPTFDPFFFH